MVKRNLEKTQLKQEKPEETEAQKRARYYLETGIYHVISPDLNVGEEKPWEKTDPTEDEQQLCREIIDEGVWMGKFAGPAVRAVFGDYSQAKFFDDFLWMHMGDPIRMGSNPAKSPAIDDGLSVYRHDYNNTVLNSYTDEGQLIHVRQTYDRFEDEREQYLVIVGDMEEESVHRYRINEIIHQPDFSGTISTKLTLTTDMFDRLDGKTPYDASRSARGIMAQYRETEKRRHAHERQAHLVMSNQLASFQLLGEPERANLGSIDKAVRDRHFLTQLAIAGCIERDDQQPFVLPQSYLNRVAA